jgi:hypothetical protein
MGELFDKHGGFRRLNSFTLATIVQLETLRFCRRFLTQDHREADGKLYDPKGRQYDQMTQAARSGRQNIIEGSERSSTSKDTEMKLTDVGRASLSELRGDYEVFILDRGEVPWSVHSPEAKAVNAVVIVTVPKSFHGPHQASDKRYYKRFNFSSFPMEHYEVEDTRARRGILGPLISVELVHGKIFKFVIRNIGQAAAFNLKFIIPEGVKWAYGGPPRQFVEGISALLPGVSISVPFASYPQFGRGKDSNAEPSFALSVVYEHGATGGLFTEEFRFGRPEFDGAAGEGSYFKDEVRDVNKHMKLLVQAVDRIARSFK